jgi:hypothetical protein
MLSHPPEGGGDSFVGAAREVPAIMATTEMIDNFIVAV